MKASVFDEYGPPEVLRVAEVETPTPEADQIRIRVRAVSVGYGDIMVRNLRDLSLRDFNMPLPLWLPVRLMFGFRRPRTRILGSSFSGEVDAVGADVTRFAVGDAVFAYTGPAMGANAEYVCVGVDGAVAAKPANLSHEEASTLPYGGMTGAALLDGIEIRPGQNVLVNGASGAIGSCVLQLAKDAGADVTAVCGTNRVAFVKALGADEVIDYREADFTEGDRAYDLVVDVYGRTPWARCRRVLTDNGICLYVSFRAVRLLQMLWTRLRGGKRVVCRLASDSPEALARIRKLAEKGAISTVVDRVFPLERAAEAHRYYESPERKANVVITVGQDPETHAQAS